MSKTGHTKNKILELIGSEDKVTLTYISERLKLNPSTVSQHLKELKVMGAVEEEKNIHIKKWKYYRINPNFDHNSISIEAVPRANPSIPKITFYLIILGLVAALTVGYILSASNSNSPKSSLVQISLTDPPTVPAGTTALYINYSSVSLQVTGNGTSKWIQSDDNGTIDVMKLINFSQVIAGIEVPKGSKITLLKLNINAARIVINGTSYELILRDNQISTSISGNINTNETSEILADLSPVVVAMYINGQNVLVMTPQVTSVSVLINSSTTSGGQTNQSARSKLSPAELRVLQLTNSNLSITKGSLLVSKDLVNLALTVTNNGNKSVVLKDLMILGKQNISNFTGTYVPFPTLPVSPNHIGAEFSIGQNGSMAFTDGTYLASSLTRINYSYPYDSSGYALNPDQSVTLNFSGPLPISNSTYIELINSVNYKITVLGDHVGHLVTNISAT
jgi:DNA-binding transcriptional ArsR family regulator